MSRILLTGAGGFVGQRIKALLPVLEAPSLRNTVQEDICRIIDQIEPDVVIHTAAISDIGACERDPEASWHANVQIPVFLAKAAPTAKLLMFSTDQVYSGAPDDGPYAEENVRPANTYARHKLEMERRVLDISPSAVMLRATWMYDMPVFGAKNRGNFLMNVLRAAASGEEMHFSSKQYRGVTYAREVALRVAESLGLPGGVYNFGSENEMSMYDTARFLINELKLNVSLQDAESRHNLWMDCAKLRSHGVDFMPTREALQACVRDYSL